MPVGHVENRDLPEFIPDLCDGGLLVDDPERVPDFSEVSGRKIIHRIMLFGIPAHKRVQGFSGCISEKDRPCIGIESIDMACPVIFFVLPCKFMFFDNIVFIIIH